MGEEPTIWDRRNAYWRAKETASRLRTELRRAEQEVERGKLKRLSAQQRLVMAALEVDVCYEGERCFYRRGIEKTTGLTRTQVGRALGALRRLGFVAHHRGLFTDDGEVAGSGYAMTKAGHAWWWSKEVVTAPDAPALKPQQHQPQ